MRLADEDPRSWWILTEINFTFAIVNWNTRDLLDACLASIYETAEDEPVQVLVADNHSGDGSAEMVATRYPEVTLIRNERNLGFAGGHKGLFELSRGHYHILVNSDVRIMPGALDSIRVRLESDPEIGVLGCAMIGPDGQLQPSCRRFPTLWYQLLEAGGLSRLFPRHPFFNAYKMGNFDHRRPREVDQVMGSFFVIRDKLLRKIGPLDTAFFMYYEEVDYCLRCRNAGFKVFYEAGALVRHEGGGSSKKVKVETIRRTMRSMRHYFRKNRGRWTWLPIWAIVSLDLVTHSLHALLTRNRPLLTMKAYSLAAWDVVTFERADL